MGGDSWVGPRTVSAVFGVAAASARTVVFVTVSVIGEQGVSMLRNASLPCIRWMRRTEVKSGLQEAVHGHVGVAPDRRRKVRVVGDRKRIVPRVHCPPQTTPRRQTKPSDKAVRQSRQTKPPDKAARQRRPTEAPDKAGLGG